MTVLLLRWVIKPLLQLFRWTLAIALWLATLLALAMGTAALARIFTGDPEFGALDGVQFTESLYTAVFRFIIAAVLLLLLQRTLRWRPTDRFTAMIEARESQKSEDAERALAVAAKARAAGLASTDGLDPTTVERDGHDIVDGGPVGSDEIEQHADTERDRDGSGRPKEKLKGRPRAWVAVD